MNLYWFKSQITRPRILGTTFSQLQCNYFGIDYQNTFLKVCQLQPDIIRIGTYMDEIIEEGFEKTDWIINSAEDHGIALIVTVGAKAPRYPEMHLPTKLKNKLKLHELSNQVVGSDKVLQREIVRFVKLVLKRYKDKSIIHYWQVENEALDHLDFAGNHSIDPDFYRQEVALVYQLKNKHQKVLINNAVNLPDSENNFQQSLEIKPDAIAFNVYAKVPNHQGGYFQLSKDFWNTISENAKLLQSNGIEPWITESQAEPWELPGNPVHIKERNYPSSDPQQAIELSSKLTKTGYDRILLWGCEHWIYHLNQGHTEWVDAMKPYFAQAA